MCIIKFKKHRRLTSFLVLNSVFSSLRPSIDFSCPSKDSTAIQDKINHLRSKGRISFLFVNPYMQLQVTQQHAGSVFLPHIYQPVQVNYEFYRQINTANITNSQYPQRYMEVDHKSYILSNIFIFCFSSTLSVQGLNKSSRSQLNNFSLLAIKI